MWIVIFGIVFIIAILVTLVLSIIAIIHLGKKRKRRKAKIKEESVLQGISAGISAQLHAIYPDSKWRWVSRFVDFATNKGIARIEVKPRSDSDEKVFMDVCLGANGYMAIHVLDVVELAAFVTNIANIDTDHIPLDFDNPISGNEAFIPSAAPVVQKPHDEETISSWYNIVLIDKLTALIDDLHANGEVCLFIGQNGRAYVENAENRDCKCENGDCKGNNCNDDGCNDGNCVTITSVCNFGEMPDISLWGFITDKLSMAGLLAEVQEENRIFISWA